MTLSKAERQCLAEGIAERLKEIVAVEPNWKVTIDFCLADLSLLVGADPAHHSKIVEYGSPEHANQ